MVRSKSVPMVPFKFFVYTYLASWLIWIPLVLSRFDMGPVHVSEGVSSIVRLLGVLMPASCALALTARSSGRAGVRTLLKPLGTWHVGWQWWCVAALVQPALLVLTALIYNALGGQPAIVPLPWVSAGALLVNAFFLLLATLGEEIGWRGLALPALQQRYSALTASLILGILWATWHLPFWMLLDTFDQFGIQYLILNFLLILPTTLYITWFFNHGQSSLLLAVAFHICFNLVNVAWLPVTTNVTAFGILIVVEWTIAILLVPHLETDQAIRA